MIEKTLSVVSTKANARYLALFLSGLICALGQPDRHFVFSLMAYFFGYSSAIFLFLESPSRKERFLLSFLWASGIELFQLNWLATTHYHGMGIVTVYLCLSFAIALQFALLFLILPMQKQISLRFAPLLAAIWCIIEWSRLYYLCGFPFNAIGLLLTFGSIPMQLASIFGVYGLSFWVMFTAILGALSWKTASKKSLVLWVFSLSFPLLFGALHVSLQKKQATSLPPMDVMLIQTGLSSEQKWQFPGREEEVISTSDQWKRIFSQLKASGLEKFDLIVLPEVTLPGDAYESMLSYTFVVNELIQKKDRLPPLVAPFAEIDDEGDWFVSHAWISQAMANLYRSEVVIGLLSDTYNAALHFIPFQRAPSQYNKRVLVPLAEYLPIPMLKSFMEKFGIFAFFTPGEKAEVFLGKASIATSICYEEGYNYLMREGREKGANLFVNISNDGWFPDSRLPIEHFNLGRIRSVENGVPVLRACNTGVTAIIDSYGEVVARLDTPQAGFISKKIRCDTYKTLFAKFGNDLILSISMVVISLCIALNSKFG